MATAGYDTSVRLDRSTAGDANAGSRPGAVRLREDVP
jgi:hypothetical protein